MDAAPSDPTENEKFLKIFPQLTTNPAANWPAWIKSIRHSASMRFRSKILPYGLLIDIMDPVAYQALPAFARRGPPDAEGVLGPLLHPMNPDFTSPADPAGNAGGGTIALWKVRKDFCDAYTKASEDFRNEIIISIGATLQADQTDVVTETILFTSLELVQNMSAKFAVRTEADRSKLKLKLDQPITSDDAETFQAYYVAFRDVIQELARAGYPVNQADAMEKFSTSTSMYPAIVKAISNYTITNPLLGDRTLAALATYVRLQLTNVTVEAAGFANSSIGQAYMTTDMVAEAFEAAFANFAQKHQKVGGDKHSGKNKLYCYVHGYGTHSGRANTSRGTQACRTMQKANLAKKDTYIATKLDASGPTSVAGGHA